MYDVKHILLDIVMCMCEYGRLFVCVLVLIGRDYSNIHCNLSIWHNKNSQRLAAFMADENFARK